MKKFFTIFIGVIFIIYILAINIISSNKIAFSMPVVILGIALIIYGFIEEKLLAIVNKSGIFIKAFKVIKYGIICLVTLLVVIEVVIIAYPKYDTSESDYILVLGAGLSDGKYPSLILSYRLDKAIEYYNLYEDNIKIVVSGGKGSDESLSEAVAMKNYLVAHGISENMILMEDKSTSTFENFKFSKDIIEEDSNKSIEDVNVKIVTTDFHAFRSEIIAKKNGYSNISNYSSKTVWYLVPISYFREAFALIKSIVFD